MKKFLLKFILATFGLFGLLSLAVLLYLEFNFDSIGFDHSLNSDQIVILEDSISPDKNFIYYQYQFDNGGYGYSKSFWAVTKNGNTELEKFIIPDGYKINGWTESNELELEKWEPYYFKENFKEMENGDSLHVVKILITVPNRK
jgi:hypothetical protein